MELIAIMTKVIPDHNVANKLYTFYSSLFAVTTGGESAKHLHVDGDGAERERH